jgi:PAS domain S-box-containing protein
MRNNKILLVEDEALIAMSEARMLGSHGFDVVTAHNANQAVESVREDPEISLVLMDIDLGDHETDGTDAARTILGIRDLPIIFLTSHSEKEYVDKVKEITGYGYVLKNAGEFVLIESINMAYSLFAARRDAQRHLAESEEAYRELELREKRLQHVNRVLLSIRNVNQIITQETDPSILLEKASRLMIETSGYHKAWIVPLRATGEYGPVFHAGFNEELTDLKDKLREGDIPRCAREAMERREVIVTEDPVNECPNCPFRYQYNSISCAGREQVTFTAPLQYRQTIYGWISVILPTFYSSNPDEVNLFSEVAGDLAYALHGIRLHNEKLFAERALRESREKYKALYENAPLPYQSLNEEGNFIDVNPAWLKTLGYDRDEVIGRNFADFLHPDWREHFTKNFPRFKERGFVHDVQYRIRRKDGEYRDISFEGCIGQNENGSFRQTYCVFKDITEEKRADTALRENRDFLEAVFQSIQDGISVLDPDLTIRYVNPVMERWYAASAPLTGKKCYTVYHDFNQPCSPCPSLRCMQSGETESEIVKGSPDPDSPVKWIELYSYPLKNSDTGEVTGVIEFVRDITERVRASEQLQESEARWQFALEGAGDGVWDWDAETGKVYFSSRWKAMLGYENHEIGDTVDEWESRIHPDDREETFRSLKEHLSGRAPSYRNEHRLLTKSGEYKWILDRGKVIERKEDGSPKRVIGTHTDINEQKKTEQQLQKALEEKEYLMQELNHRVKNNLAMISSLISLKNGALSEQEDLSDVRHQIDAIRIVHEILFHSEDISHIDIRQYGQEILETIFSSFTTRKVRVENEIDCYSLRTKTAVPLGLIINELATNAIKHGFTDDQEAVFTVRLQKENDDGRFVFTLSNSGRPFPEEVDLHSPDTLGLQLLSTLVGQLNGTIELSKQPSPTFTIRFQAQEE